jgi:alanine-synthesizing transaminase
MVQAMVANLAHAEGYCDSKGLIEAREAILHYTQLRQIRDASLEDVYIGNGVSELIVMAMQGLLNNGHEILIPAPDYPLWTAAVNLAGGKAVHYRCDEESGWIPDLRDIKKKINARTKGIVVINPNNPTGAVYPQQILEKIVKLAQENGLIVFSDEIYDTIVYDEARHVSIASLADDILFVTFNGLSKSCRAAGFRVGWMVLSGKKEAAQDYVEGLDILASMRLCSNVPGMYAIPEALKSFDSIERMIAPGGRLYKQRDVAWRAVNVMPGVSCVKPQGAFYLFPRIDAKRIPVRDDMQLILDLLLQENILVVQGTGFNWPRPDHIRIVFLPSIDELETAMGRMHRFFSNYKQ